MRSIISALGGLMKLAGYGLFGLVLFSGIFILRAAFSPQTSGAPIGQAFMAWLLYGGLPGALLGAALIWGARSCEPGHEAAEGRSGEPRTQDEDPAAAQKKIIIFMLKAAAGLIMLAVIAAGAMFINAGSRRSAYSADRGLLYPGTPAADVATAMRHADIIRVDWKENGRLSYRGPGAMVTFPETTAGLRDAPLALRGEYRIAGFHRKFIDVDLDAQGKAAGIKESSLD